MNARVHWPGLITLLLLSPLGAELLSGSAPPAEFFSVFGFVFIVAWYGIGVVLCRELSVRWQGWLAGLFLLGMAFGVLEEGIFVKTFFDPHAIDLGVFQEFGWWAGANWPWIVQLTLYHALVSITLPVVVVATLWPGERDQPWLSRRVLYVLAGILCTMAVLGWFILSPAGERPPFLPGPGQFAGAALAAALLVLLARRVRRPAAPSSLMRRWPLFLAGLAWGAWFLGTSIVAETTRSALWTTLWTGGVGAALLAFGYVRVRALDAFPLVGAGTYAAGVYFFWALIAPLQQLDNANRPDDTGGMALVGLVALLLIAAYLFILRRAWRRIRTERPSPSATPTGAGAPSV